MVFRLLVVAEGHTPVRSPARTDPGAGAITLNLTRHDLDKRDEALVFRGRVMDEKDKSVPGAIIEPRGFWKGNRGQFGGLKGIDPLAVANEKGEFRIGVSETGIALHVLVSARGLAPKAFNRLDVGPKAHELRLNRGVTVTGRVTQDGKPLAEVALGLVTQNRGTTSFVGDFKILTDEQGKFTFLNVPADEAYYIYGLMDSCRSFGAIPAQRLKVGAAGTRANAGTITMQTGYRLSGKLVLSDGKPLPQDIRVLFSRREAWDSQTTIGNKDGSFSFSGLPAEPGALVVNVPNYHVSPKNANFDLINQGGLIGTVAGNVSDLVIVLEPGPSARLDRTEVTVEKFTERKRRQASPFSNVAPVKKK